MHNSATVVWVCCACLAVSSLSMATDALAQREEREERRRNENGGEGEQRQRENGGQNGNRGQSVPQQFTPGMYGRGGMYGRRGGPPPVSPATPDPAAAAQREREISRQREREREIEREKLQEVERDVRRFRESQLILDRMDVNRNGLLDPGEVTDRSRRQVETAATRAGVDLQRPVRLDRLAVAMANVNPANLPAGAIRSMVPGFSTENKSSLSLPPDFDIPVPGIFDQNAGGQSTAAPTLVIPDRQQQGRNNQERSERDNGNVERRRNNDEEEQRQNRENNERDNNRDDKDKNKGEDEEDNERFRRMAELLLRQNDADRDRTLKRGDGEWANLQPRFARADEDDDDVITLDELTAYVEKDSRRSGGERENDERNGSDGDSDDDVGSDRAESLRHLLPDWFLDKDRDEDGQVSMSEFETDWTDVKVTRYRRYDRNNDGVITPAECLNAESKRPLERPRLQPPAEHSSD